MSFSHSLEILARCDSEIGPDKYLNYPKYINIKRNSDTLIIDVTVLANCCPNFLGEAEVTGTDTLNLLYTSYGGFCSCNCCFTLRYKFNTSMEEYAQTLKYVTINGSGRDIGKVPRKE